MERYIIDTNIVSNYFKNILPPEGKSFMRKVFNAIPNISVITQIELLSWETDEQTSQRVNAFVYDSLIYNINSQIVAKAVEIRKSKKVKTPDAIIAATALTNNYTLVTNNEKDFVSIPNLKIINPHKL